MSSVDPNTLVQPEQPQVAVAEAPVAIDPRFSKKIYPRIDNIYKSKRSLNYDLLRTKIFRERKPLTKCHGLVVWMPYAILGSLVGLTASIMSYIEEGLTEWKKNYVGQLIDGEQENMFNGWLFYAGFSMACVGLSSLMTVYYGPGANGSGVAELIGYMNGVNYPGIFSFETFIVKVFGVVLAVVGGLCVGKEGPLAHIGAIIGVYVCYLPLPGFEWFQNDEWKRNLIAAGTSAGVSAAFGAPIGGTLFAYETSKPNTFWRFSVIWKVFFTCAIATFSLAICNSLIEGEGVITVSAGVLKFGNTQVDDPSLTSIPSSLITGIFCGLLGALFITVNTYMGVTRKTYITKQWQRPLEAIFFAFMTTTTFYWAPYIFHQCEKIINDEGVRVITVDDDLIVQYNCAENELNPLASLFMNTEGSAIRMIISGFSDKGFVIDTLHMFIYFICWYFFTITTYGVWVPAGLFLPGIILGCAVGSIYETLRVQWFPESGHASLHVTPILCAAGAMLAGYTRMTYSLVVIMLETTQSINLFLPMMIGIFVARSVGNYFTKPLYDRALRTKNIPLLRSHIPKETIYCRAELLMAKNPVSLKTICSVKDIQVALSTTHNAFPVINTGGHLVGLIPKHVVVVLCVNRTFYNKDLMKEFSESFGAEQATASANFGEEKAVRTSINDQEQKIIVESFLSIPEGENPNSVNKSTITANSNPSVLSANSNRSSYHQNHDELEGFKPTPQAEIMCWSKFNININSDEAKSKHVIEVIAQDDPEELVDLRPYMIEHPYHVYNHDDLYKCLEMFRHLHLRHLPVVTPSDGRLCGVITRKDLFAYMGL